MYNKDLELAAKAAGYVVHSKGSFGAVWVYLKDDVANEDGEHQCFLWNPENDDADSFRLSVKLQILPQTLERTLNTEAVQVYCGQLSTKWCIENEVLVDGNVYEATRSAIFKAAVELGRRLM